MMLDSGTKCLRMNTMHFMSMVFGNCVSCLLVGKLSVVAGSIALRQTRMAQSKLSTTLPTDDLEPWETGQDSDLDPFLTDPSYFDPCLSNL